MSENETAGGGVSRQENHHIEVETPRHFETTVEIWCPTVDEAKVVLGERYLRHCPMCGEEIQ